MLLCVVAVKCPTVKDVVTGLSGISGIFVMGVGDINGDEATRNVMHNLRFCLFELILRCTV